VRSYQLAGSDIIRRWITPGSPESLLKYLYNGYPILKTTTEALERIKAERSSLIAPGILESPDEEEDGAHPEIALERGS